jgi:hypothetical protein
MTTMPPPPPPPPALVYVPAERLAKLKAGFDYATHPDELIGILADFFDDPGVAAAAQHAFRVI